MFVIGLVYSSIFRLTSNILILYPFLTPNGALFTQIKEGLSIPFPATYGFLDVILFAIIGLALINKAHKKYASQFVRRTA
ncbi:MAG TPA: hypothetical protein DER33_01720 [Syntrophomonas sp.]|nr:hypothetical protein [Syntrophomonas sp.]